MNARTGPLRAGLFILLAACGPRPEEVVVYTSVDEVYARGIFERFTSQTGIAVLPLFDTEEAKTLGLVHRLVAEKADPRADVFWNGECVRTALLKAKGILEPYRSPASEAIGAAWKDADAAWTGFGARARVIVYNTERVKDPPRTLRELADPKWKGRIAMAGPVFGTTAAHAAALAQVLGEEETLKLFRDLRDNGVRLVGGNSHVRDLVARGSCDAGLTDTDDVWIGKLRGDPIGMVFPDQEGAGTLVIPNTVALVRGAPHPEAARKFIDFLLSPGTERLLAEGRSRQMPVRPDATPAPEMPSLGEIRAMKVDWGAIADAEAFLERAREVLER